MEASIKGMLLEPPMRRVRRLVDAGKLDEDALEEWLEPGEETLLFERPHAGFWYPIALHDRLLRLLCRFEGGDDPRWLVEFGRSEADDVLSRGPLRTLVQGASGFGSRAGVALVRMADLAFNFGRWRFRGEGMEEFAVEADGVEDLPESFRWVLEGFIAEVAHRVAGVELCVTSERPVPHRVRFEAAAADGGARPPSGSGACASR